MNAPAPRSPGGEGELRVQVPPGWLPLTGAVSDEQAEAAFTAAVAPFRDKLNDRGLAALHQTFRDGRQLALGAGFHLAGALPTRWKQKIPTVWFYGMRVLRGVGGGAINPVALVERYLRVGLADPDSAPADFYAVDGRVGTSLHTTLPRQDLPDVEVGIAPMPVKRRLPNDPLGVVVAALPLPGSPRDVLLLFGAAPHAEQRSAMAIFASIMIHSAHVVGGKITTLRTVDLHLAEAFGPGQRDPAGPDDPDSDSADDED